MLDQFGARNQGPGPQIGGRALSPKSDLKPAVARRGSFFRQRVRFEAGRCPQGLFSLKKVTWDETTPKSYNFMLKMCTFMHICIFYKFFLINKIPTGYPFFLPLKSACFEKMSLKNLTQNVKTTIVLSWCLTKERRRLLFSLIKKCRTQKKSHS